ncbi:hypothetical protein ACFVDT_07055 [Streptomyces sp. NPDC057699]|uniref:hypothetical protein n=1 Tax=Streptomyces sp. NPDC057699 TaxID=3346220 RepID=UPI003677AE58
MTVNDRIRAAALPADRTELDTTLLRVLAMPSLAAQLLTTAADHLAKVKDDQPLTLAGWGRALALADARTLSGYPQHIAENASLRAMRALSADLWATARTRGEWALILRDAARTV